MVKIRRSVSTVLFTDIVGSTQRMAELGDRRWQALIKEHNARVRRELDRFGGREINTAGDAFLATFAGPARAIRCACAIRDAVRPLGIEVRAGVHTGEVEVSEDGVGGIAVHIGARIAAKAVAGEVLTSSTVRDLLAGSEFGFEDRGTQALKGVPGEWRLFAASGQTTGVTAVDFWSRLRKTGLAPVLLVFLIVCWPLFWIIAFLQERLQLPGWLVPAAAVLLIIGLVVVAATAWVQSHPLAASRAETEEVPGEWEIDLREMREAVARGRLPHLTWGRAILGGVVAFSMLFGLAGLYMLYTARGSTPVQPAASSLEPAIAVLPFTVSGPELDDLREGMVDLLSTNLDGVAGLRMINSRTVLARWSENVHPKPDLETTLEVARQAGARYALVGSAVAVGSSVRLSVRIYDVANGGSLGQAQVDGSSDRLTALVDRLSLEVLRVVLRVAPGELPPVDLAGLMTESLPALKAYLAGETFFRRSQFDKAIHAYQRALEADSSFALALYRLGSAYSWWAPDSEWGELAEPYLIRAARLSDRLSPRKGLLLRAELAYERGTLDGLPSLKQAVFKYPDDVEAWHLLGETTFHLGAQALLGPEESEKAFLKAVELDPSFTLPYTHLVDLAFTYHADSAQAARFVDAFGDRTGDRELDGLNRHTFALAFGDSVTRERAVAALDTLSPRERNHVLLYLWNPSFDRVRGAVLESRLGAARETGTEDWLLRMRFLNDLGRGKLKTAFEYLERPRAAQLRPVGLYAALMMGAPSSAERLERGLIRASSDGIEDLQLFYTVAYAGERGRWAEHDSALASIRRYAERGFATGDSSGARFAEGISLALEGHSLWKQGRRPEAVEILASAQRRATGWGRRAEANAMIRLWLGKLLLELQQPQEAERYLRPKEVDPYQDWVWQDYLIDYYLGKAYEDLREYAKARSAYGSFATAWREADPELQGLVEEAREAVGRLGTLQMARPPRRGHSPDSPVAALLRASPGRD